MYANIAEMNLIDTNPQLLLLFLFLSSFSYGLMNDIAVW